MAMCWLELYEGTLRTPRMAMGTSPKDRRSKYMPLTTEGQVVLQEWLQLCLDDAARPHTALRKCSHIWAMIHTTEEEGLGDQYAITGHVIGQPGTQVASPGTHLHRAVSKAGHSIWSASLRNLHIRHQYQCMS